MITKPKIQVQRPAAAGEVATSTSPSSHAEAKGTKKHESMSVLAHDPAFTPDTQRMLAGTAGHVEVVEKLLGKGASVAVHDKR